MNTKKLILFVAAFFIAMNLYAYTERNILQKEASVDKLKTILVQHQKWVPYPAYSDRGGWDNLLGDWKDGYIERGEKQLDYQWTVVKATDYIEFERSGNRRIMEDPFGKNNTAIADLVMAELAEGKGRFINQIINGVFQACEMTSWCLSAHLGSFQQSHRSLPESHIDVFDLTVGDMGSLLSWTYYFFHEEFDKVNPEISKRLRDELQRRILDTYMNEDRFWWLATNYKSGDKSTINNWNPWCNFNALQCFLLLEQDIDKLAAATYKTMVSVDKFINYTKSDGACEEGPSYWGHAAGKMYDYLQILYDATAGKISVFDNPVIRNMGEYISRSYIGDGWVVNFADASAKGGGEAPLVYRYGKAVGSKEMMTYAAYLESIEKNKNAFSSDRDIFRTLQTCLFHKELALAEPKHETPEYTWYPETEFCYMKDKAGFFFAAKGGYNNESHNHNDVGSFSLYLNNVPMFIDAGVGTYTRQTFSNERYSIWTMQSDYHNLPMINGVPEKPGFQYKATDASFNAAGKTFSANIATAYPSEANVSKWIRSYTLKNGTLKISDKFKLNKADAANVINFLTWGKVDVSTPGTIIVEAKGQKVKLSYDRNVFDATIETVKLDDKRLSNVWGDEIYRVSLTAKSLATSGNYTYSITKP